MPVQFNVTMPAQYVDRLQRRADLSGASRSEEIRKAIDASESRSSSATPDLAAASRSILASSIALRRLLGASASGGAVGGFLDKIEAEAESLGKLAGP